jgi:predicted Rossmann fold flavoprotein
MKTIAVIGAGPAGILAALKAAELGAHVQLFEANPIIGRKLLVTGAGRCNITNLNASPERYACADPAFMQTILVKISPQKLRGYLSELGILTYATADGWCYPLSESAQAVADLFLAALVEAKVEIHFSTRIRSVKKDSTGFVLHSDGHDFHVPTLIVSAGGKSFPKLGSTGELFSSLENLGHTIEPLRPALAPVLADMHAYQKLQGVRLDASVTLYEGNHQLAHTKGNLIFTSWGLNGPAVMDLSHHISQRPGSALCLGLNLLLDYENEVRALLPKKGQSKISALLESILPPKVASFVIELCAFPPAVTYQDLKTVEREKLIRQLTNLLITVRGVRGFEYCQLKAGGVPVTELDATSMQSRHVPGLFLAGETLDVVGPCGGYNLHFASSSGWLAGQSAAAS